jgi:hypothetical protein
MNGDGRIDDALRSSREISYQGGASMYQTMPWILAWLFGAYVIVSTSYGIKIARGPMMKWYYARSFFVAGKGPIYRFVTHMVFRIGWEVVVMAVCAVVGTLGGAIYLIFLKPKEAVTSGAHE